MLDQAKVIQKMVQEIGLKNIIIDDEEDIPEEQLPSPPEIPERELTTEEIEGKTIYESASAVLNKTRPDKNHGYQLLMEAAKKGNTDAKGLVAWGLVFGNPLPQDLATAKDMFQELADVGNPDGHTGLGKFNLFTSNIIVRL